MQHEPLSIHPWKLGGLASAILLCAHLAIAQKVQTPASEVGVRSAQEATEQGVSPAPGGVAGLTPAGARDYPQQVHLRVDGNVAGRVSVLDAVGRPLPARATIYFVQGGQIVTSTRSDRYGHFQAVGLKPGTYSVIATYGRSVVPDRKVYVGAFAVHVAPYAENASQRLLLLHITLVPTEDLRRFVEEKDDSREPLPRESQPSVTGGGGGGLGALLGLGGLGGLAGLAGQREASPHVP